MRNLAMVLLLVLASAGLFPTAKALNATCPRFCSCATEPVVCLQDFVANPPKDAILISPVQPFCNAMELELLARGRDRCKTPQGRLMDCLRQKIPKSSCDFHPSLVASAGCKCPSTTDICRQLPKLNTTAYGGWVPSKLFTVAGCRPPLKATRPVLGDSQCDSFATIMSSLMNQVIASFWPQVLYNLNDPLDLGDKVTSSFSDVDLGVYYMRGNLGLDTIAGLKSLSAPTINIVDMPACTDIKALKFKVAVTESVDKLTLNGGVNLVFHAMFAPTLKPRLSLGVTCRNPSIKLAMTANAGLVSYYDAGAGRVFNKGTAAITSIDDLNIDFGNITFDFDVYSLGLAGWLVGEVVEVIANILAKLFFLAEPKINERLLKEFRNNLMSKMQGSVDFKFK